MAPVPVEMSVPDSAAVVMATYEMSVETEDNFDPSSDISTGQRKEVSESSSSEGCWAIAMQDAESQIIGQLKEKFHSSVKRNEKMRILTILPKSLSVRRIMKEFGAPNYMARQAKKLVQEKGILSSPNPKPGKTLSPIIEEQVVDVYQVMK